MPDDPPRSESPLAVMIVDDERPARRRLRSMIETIGNARVVAEADCLETARAALTNHRIDLLLLDIQIAPGNGFDLLSDVPPEAAVVFVTAHSDFAVQAFEEEALDYLLKPVREERLARALEKCRLQNRASPAEGANEILYLGDRSNLRRVPVGDIVAVLAEDTYSRVLISDGGNILVLRSLKEWTEILPTAEFVRLDRSVLVNLGHVSSFRIHDRDHAEIEVDGYSSPIRLGRAAIARAKKHLAG